MTLRLEDAIAYRIHRTARVLRKQFHDLAAAAGVDLTQEQWFILNKLMHHDGVSQGELVDDLFGDRPNISRMIVALEARGDVVRRPDADDARKVRVFLTAAGRRAHDAFSALVPVARKRIARGISAADLDVTRRVLAQIEANAAGSASSSGSSATSSSTSSSS
jgi:DNA-binding MarR family transcriptional regulator